MSEEKKPNVEYYPGRDNLPPLKSPIQDGMTAIHFPSPDEQIANPRFYTKHSRVLLKHPQYIAPRAEVAQPETDLPNDFPSREVFRGLGKNVADLKGLTQKQLEDLPKIGEVTAKRVIEYFEKEGDK